MKKGFTLIELLAVIVVLAIVAIISVPIVGNVINSGKTEATENSTSFYVKEIEDKFSEWIIEGIPTELSYDDSETGYIIFDVQDLNSVLKLEGEKPISGYVKVDNDYSADNYFFGYVISAELKYDNGYTATYTYNTSSSDATRSNITITKK